MPQNFGCGDVSRYAVGQESFDLELLNEGDIILLRFTFEWGCDDDLELVEDKPVVLFENLYIVWIDR